MPFTPEGRVTQDVRGNLKSSLDRLTSAPLKPAQRLWALRVVVLPSIYYHLSMGETTCGYLRSIDRLVRSTVRTWLHLPGDCPNAYFHATVNDGGLGIRSVRWSTPLDRARRLGSLLRRWQDMSRIPDSYIEEEVRKAELRLNTNDGFRITSKYAMDKWWSSRLYSSVDGGPLKGSSLVKGQHSWVADGTKFLSGKDFVNSIKIRIGALPTRSRMGRGRRRERTCRAGCMLVETANHVIQNCHRTHGTRINRHDAIVNYVAKKMESSHLVQVEPHYNTSAGLRKPDIVATLDNTTIILDAQVVSEQTDLEKANSAKIRKYKNDRDLISAVRYSTGSTNIPVHAITLNWRGVWSSTAAQDLVRLGIIRKADLKVISTRVLLGSIICWRTFNKMTTTRRRCPRAGVG